MVNPQTWTYPVFPKVDKKKQNLAISMRMKSNTEFDYLNVPNIHKKVDFYHSLIRLLESYGQKHHWKEVAGCAATPPTIKKLS